MGTIYFLVPFTYSTEYKITRRSNCVVKSKGDYIYPPIELATIAAWVREHGYRVDLIDGNACAKIGTIIDRIRDPEYFVVNVGIVSFENDMRFITALRKHWPSARIIAYGQAATALPLDVLAYSDYVCIGEPEQTILDVLTRNPSRAVCYKKKNGSIVSNTEDNIVPLDTLPLPARDLIDNSRYRHAFLSPFTEIFTSRGCPYRCVFCTSKNFFGAYRTREALSIKKELIEIRDKYHLKYFSFADDTFTINRPLVKEICEFMIATQFGMKWIALSRVDTIDAETLSLMKRAGCMMVLYGIESGSQEVLDKLKKDTSVSRIVETIKMTKNVGLEAHGYFVLGSPYDTPETIRTTIAFAKSLGLDYASFNTYVPYPNTELFSELSKEGKLKEITYGDFDQNSGAVVFTNDNLSDKELQKLVRSAYLEFYLNPAYILRTLIRHLFSPMKLGRDIANFIVMTKNLMKNNVGIRGVSKKATMQ